MTDILVKLGAYEQVDAEWLGMTDRREILHLLPKAAKEIVKLREILRDMPPRSCSESEWNLWLNRKDSALGT